MRFVRSGCFVLETCVQIKIAAKISESRLLKTLTRWDSDVCAPVLVCEGDQRPDHAESVLK